MPSPPRPRLHHIAITVTDLDASIAWYERVFGIAYQMGGPHEGGVGKLLTDSEWRLIIVLHRHDANQHERFAETRTGLDHVGFSVPSRAELEAWQAHLQELGVVQSPIADTPYGSILVFRDPDNIRLDRIGLISCDCLLGGGVVAEIQSGDTVTFNSMNMGTPVKLRARGNWRYLRRVVVGRPGQR